MATEKSVLSLKIEELCSNLKELHENSGSNCEVYRMKMAETWALIRILDEFYDDFRIELFETLYDLDWAREYFIRDESESFCIEEFDFHFSTNNWEGLQHITTIFRLALGFEDDGTEHMYVDLYRTDFSKIAQRIFEF